MSENENNSNQETEEATVLLQINSVDFTDNVIQKSYRVQQQDEYEEWTDGNWITHREIVRTRINGTIALTFTSETDYAGLTGAIAAVKTSGGYCPITLWVNNTKSLETINAFLIVETEHRWTTPAFGMTPEIAAVTLKIKQR